MLTQMKKYVFIADAAHGWLKVEINELIALNIQKDISNDSYIDLSTGNVYLEEDLDLNVFLSAKFDLPEKIESYTLEHRNQLENFWNDTTHIQVEQSAIRHKQPYHINAVKLFARQKT